VEFDPARLSESDAMDTDLADPVTRLRLLDEFKLQTRVVAPVRTFKRSGSKRFWNAFELLLLTVVVIVGTAVGLIL
jgi:hypothetical protein